MKTRQLAASITVSALAVVGLHATAGAAGPTFSVSDTTITAGGSVTVHLDVPCTHDNGDPDFGNVITSSTSGPQLDNQETKGEHFIKGGTGVIHFDTPGTYTITRFCDRTGQLDQVTITVTAPTSPSTTTTTTSTTSAPRSTSTTTTTTPRSGSTTTTTTTPTTAGGTSGTTTTTTAAVKVAGVSTTKDVTSAATKAVGATAVAGTVSYTG